MLLLLAGARYAQKSSQKHQVFSNGDFLSAEEKIYGLSVIWETAKTYYKDMSMSKNAVYDQLISEYGEQFTESEAQYAIDHLD